MRAAVLTLLLVAGVSATFLPCSLATAQESQPQSPAKPQAAARKVRPSNPAFAKVVDDPKLPRVLLIGDSISIGYTVAVRDLLKGQANLHRIPTNGGPTTNGVKNIDAWLGDSKWDVIHFNWGLHDVKYIDDKSALVAPEKGRQQVSPTDYEANLRQLVKRLKQTGAKLIWCSTTPIPEGSNGRVPGDEVKFNTIAAKVMADEGVAVDDLYTFAKPQLDKIQLPANVHFSPEGSKVLATKVVESVAVALKK